MKPVMDTIHFENIGTVAVVNRIVVAVQLINMGSCTLAVRSKDTTN